jgi:hypothetical protein
MSNAAKRRRRPGYSHHHSDRMPCGCRQSDVLASMLGDRCSWCEAGEVAHCHGYELQHDDGVSTCSENPATCDPETVPHPRGMTCGFLGPCDRCES